MSSNPDQRLEATADPYAEHHRGLVEVHHALAGSLQAVVAAADAPLDVLVPQAIAAGRFLLAHHALEDAALFPVLRRCGRLRSADAAFLDACDRAHRELHAVCERMVASATAPHPSGQEIASLARETSKTLAAHVLEEEAGLAPERMRAMLSPEGLVELHREVESARGALIRQLGP
jgi:hypothetical protein